MKIRHIPILTAAMLAASCSTTTAPDGTVTKAPDAPTVSAVGGIIEGLAGLFVPAKAVPVEPATK